MYAVETTQVLNLWVHPQHSIYYVMYLINLLSVEWVDF